MSKLTELLDELCPDGVSMSSVGDVFSAVQLPAKIKRSQYSDGTKYPIVDQGQSFICGYTDDEKALLPDGQYVVFGDHTRALKWVDFRFAAGADGTKVLKSASEVLPKFGFYALSSLNIPSRGYNRHWTILRDLQIPVPPLEVQQEIVRVLDAFTDLEQSLVSELELRKKQLNDYRHAHFANIKETDGCAVTLGEIAEVRSGWGFPKAYQGTLSGDLPFFKVGDMNLPGNETFLHSANNYISDTQAQELKVKPAPTGSIVFPKVGAAIATNKKRILTQESAFDNNVMSLVPGQKVDSDFLFHWIQTEDLVRWGNSSGGVPSIRKSDVEKVTLILPPREQQEVVASRLNVFSNLIQSIEQEISLRRQQYEFYRDELLSFAPKED